MSGADDPVTKPLASVIGAHVKTIRVDSGVTQNELAKYARGVGLRWTTSKVGEFERGQYNPTFATVLLVQLALRYAPGGRSPFLILWRLMQVSCS